MFPKRLCLSTKRHGVSSHNNDILLFTDMRTALLILILCMVYVFYIRMYLRIQVCVTRMFVCK